MDSVTRRVFSQFDYQKMVQLMVLMRVLSIFFKCVRAEPSVKEKTKKEDGEDDVDGGDGVEVTNTIVNNVTCCGGRATNRNRDEMYLRRQVAVPKPNLEEYDEDEQSSSTPRALSEKGFDKRGSRIILEINTFEE